MGFFIGLLTFVLVLNCIVLILLVLMQLPKKDAGAGLAFGGGATDALFGAGSGNVLTKATKYSATIFFVLAILIGVLQSRYHDRSTNALISATAPEAEAPLIVPDQPATSNFTLGTEAPAAASTNTSSTE
jgi:preprotein translocase subunit SecG